MENEEEPIAVAATTEQPVLDEDTSGGAADNGRPPHKRKDNHQIEGNTSAPNRSTITTRSKTRRG